MWSPARYAPALQNPTHSAAPMMLRRRNRAHGTRGIPDKIPLSCRNPSPKRAPEITLARGDGGRDQHRLPGGRKAEVLGEDGQGDRWVTEIGHELCDIHAAYTTPALASRWANLSGRYATLDVCRERAQQI